MHLNAKNNELYFFFFIYYPSWKIKQSHLSHMTEGQVILSILKRKKKCVVKQFIVKTVCGFHCKLGFCKKQYCF